MGISISEENILETNIIWNKVKDVDEDRRVHLRSDFNNS